MVTAVKKTAQVNMLLVEDDEVDAALTTGLLRRTGIDTHLIRVKSLQEAVDHIRFNRVDLVLLDLGLPDSRGLDTLIEIELWAPEIAIVVLTGNRQENLALQAIGIGADDLLSKDRLEPEMLKNTVLVTLQRHREKEELWHELAELRHEVSSALDAAKTDPLTGLPNRRGLQAHLARIRAMDDRPVVIAAMIDMDDFKHINDEHDHAAGDLALKAVAGRISGNLRPEDIAARIGGDEFLVLFTDLEKRASVAAAERILEDIRRDPVVYQKQKIWVSATVALTEVLPGEAELDKILERTHAALERGKKNGKAKVEKSWDDGGESLFSKRPKSHAWIGRYLASMEMEVTRLERPGMGETAAHWIRFKDGLDGQILNFSRLANGNIIQMSRLTLFGLGMLMKQGRWEHTVHVDIDTDLLISASFLERLKGRVPRQHREKLVLFFNITRLVGRRQGLADVILDLKESGFRIGLRGIGDGGTMIETLAWVQPSHARLNDAFCQLKTLKDRRILSTTAKMLRAASCCLVIAGRPSPAQMSFFRELGVDLVGQV